MLQHLNDETSTVASDIMLYQCNYAARVREKVAERSPCAKWALSSVLYQFRSEGRARIVHTYVVLVQPP